MPIECNETHRAAVGETVPVTVALDRRAEETLTNPTAVEVTTSDLTISNVAINTAAVTVYEDGRQREVAIGYAVQFDVDCAAAVARTTYLIDVTAEQSTRPLPRRIRLKVF